MRRKKGEAIFCRHRSKLQKKNTPKTGRSCCAATAATCKQASKIDRHTYTDHIDNQPSSKLPLIKLCHVKCYEPVTSVNDLGETRRNAARI